MTKKQQKNSSPSKNNPAGNQTTNETSQEMIVPGKGMIHPIIIYPYNHPKDIKHITALYESLIAKLAADTQKYCKPVTVLNSQTYIRNQFNKGFDSFKKNTVEAYSQVLTTWSVDTCQMWLAGLGNSFDHKKTASDVYWLIPGDFNYAGKSGKKVLRKLEEIPDKVQRGECELCLGEIDVSPNSSKQLIDTYGTYGLLYNWFPTEAQRIREKTDKPRTEFFAINHPYLDLVLKRRWYAYEQMIVILLHGMAGPRPTRDIRKVPLGEISDEEQGRDSLASAMQQVERTERVLKLFWRETSEGREGWPDTFRKLDAQSEQIRGAALVIFERVLRRD